MPTDEAQATLLLIDDEADARMTLRLRLQARHFQVLEAGDGASGLTVAKQQRPQIILLDIMMPGRDGFQVYQDLRQDPDTRQIPVLFLTALSASGPLSKEGLQLLAASKHNMKLSGPYEVMGKPFDLDELLRKIRRILTGGLAGVS